MTSKQIKYLGIDAGGTFTDFVLHAPEQPLSTYKVLSTPENPALAILSGISEMGLLEDAKNGCLKIIHGSTVATNAALEGKGVVTAFVTNKGFADMLTIGRQARSELYNLTPQVQAPPVPSNLCFEVDCRRDAQGNEIKILEDADIQNLVSDISEAVKQFGVKAVAINLLFSFIDNSEEERLEAALNQALDNVFVCRSSFVLPVYKEYERGITTWLNASLGPKVEGYMSHLKSKLPNCDIQIMQSSGGVLSIEEAAQRAVNLLLSGPAGGLAAVTALGHATQISHMLSFDMGGTSTDVSLMDGRFHLSEESKVGRWPVAIPMLEMDTIGAGGGSIAWTDEAGMLHVGPQSAGSQPGPACYGLGGEQATVTDANLLLGRLPKNAKLGGSLTLDYDAAYSAISSLAQELGLSVNETACGIVQLAEQQMVAALHNISIKQGHTPETFTLCCFGGAGGLHVCSLAEQLGMKSALIPRNAGVLSALGMLFAPTMKSATRSLIRPLDAVADEQIDALFESMQEQLLSEMRAHAELNVERSVDLRYLGQSYTIEVPYDHNASEEFSRQHERRYGHQLNKGIELVNLKLRLIGQSALDTPETYTSDADAEDALTPAKNSQSEGPQIVQRESLGTNQTVQGPAIIVEKVSTTWLPSGWQGAPDSFGNLILSQQSNSDN